MKRIFKTYIFLGLLSVMFFSCGEDTLEIIRTGFIEVTVVDAVTGDPIPVATVEISPNNQSSGVDDTGFVLFEDVPVGDYSVQASADGYLARFKSTSVVEEGTTGRVVIELEVSTTNNRPPDTLLLVRPANNSLEVPLQPTFGWKATDPDGDDLTFTLSLFENGTSNEIVFENLTDTIFDLSLQTDPVTFLDFDTRYTWQVTASDGLNQVIFSNVYSFTTIPFPDNNNVYFTRIINDNSVIFASDQEGTEDSIVPVSDFSKNSFRPRQNPGGTNSTVAFLRSVGGDTHLFTMNRDGKNVMQVTSDIPVAGFNNNEVDFTWSRDGSQLIFPSLRRLYRINPDGTGLEQLYSVPAGEFITELTPIEESTGAEFAIKVNNAEGYNTSIYTIDANGTPVDTILSSVRGAVGGLDFSFESPTQDYLVYTQDLSGAQSGNYDNQDETRIFIYDFQTDITLQITVTDANTFGRLHQDPRFSPDNTKIIFVDRNRALNSPDIRLSTVEVPFDITDTDFEGDIENLITDGQMPDWQEAQ